MYAAFVAKIGVVGYRPRSLLLERKEPSLAQEAGGVSGATGYIVRGWQLKDDHERRSSST